MEWHAPNRREKCSCNAVKIERDSDRISPEKGINVMCVCVCVCVSCFLAESGMAKYTQACSGGSASTLYFRWGFLSETLDWPLSSVFFSSFFPPNVWN